MLVHGAWHGSWCWKRVRRALQALGHEVFTPTLTGVADSVHLLSPQVNLETHITDVVNLIRWEELSDVVLCGHSYGGCVISGVGDCIPDRIGALVYLDAFVLENGQSLHDTLPPPMRNEQLEQALHSGEGWKVPPIPAEAFRVNAQDLDWVNRQCTMEPLATGWAPSPFPPFCDQAKTKGWRTVTMDCGHDVMLDLPEELTRELLAASARRSASTH